MRTASRVAPILLAVVFAGCDSPMDCCEPSAGSGLRVINAFAAPVDIIIDGRTLAANVPAGTIDTIRPSAGTHTLTLRPSNGATASQLEINTTAALNTVAAVRLSNGDVSPQVLDDTNSVVAPGKTKLRVLHLAPNAGVLQVYRTQPDFQTPISWQFPFTYQSDVNSLSAPFYESTVGTWQ